MTPPELHDRADRERQPRGAPNPGDRVSARLDERHLRRERIRKRLMWAGISWWCGLAWIAALIAVSVAGGGESNVLGAVVGSGTIVSVALLLAGHLVGRRNADWWRPRLKEMLPSGADGGGEGSRVSRRVSGRARRRRERARYKLATQVRSQIREAHVYERRRDGDGTLLGETLLVLHRSRKRALDVFDQEGNELGRVVRVLERTSKSEGNVWVAEIRDVHGEVVLALRLAPRRRRLKHAPVAGGSYAICSADGKHLAAIGPPKKAAKGFYLPVRAGGQLLAHVVEQSSSSLTVADADADGHQVAEVTIPSGVTSQSGWYVVNRTGSTDEQLRGVILAACVLWDDTRVESS